VVVEPLKVGEVQAPRGFFERAGGPRMFEQARMLGIGTPRSRWWWVPCPAFLIRHPSAGPFLVDTGLHPSVSAKPAANLGRRISWYAKPRLEPGDGLPAQLRSRGVDPHDVSLVVMTHLHFDHSSGMAEFPRASFVLSEQEWLASTPGHSAGHMSVICRLRERDLVIAGDAIYTLGQLEAAPGPPRPFDPHTFRRSLGELRHFARRYPQAVIIPGHDPETWPTLDKRYE
jgi:N-acyl homoserine lactone hydrolase